MVLEISRCIKSVIFYFFKSHVVGGGEGGYIAVLYGIYQHAIYNMLKILLQYVNTRALLASSHTAIYSRWVALHRWVHCIGGLHCIGGFTA